MIGSLLGPNRVHAYLVGGFVRDILAGRRTADIDLAIDTDPLEIGPQIAEAMKGKYICLDDSNRIARVILPKYSESSPKGYHLDFSLLANGDIQRDLARRDFTIDAMAIELCSFLEDPLQADIIDPFEGRKALEERIVRSVASGVYEADPARLLRTLRLSAEMNF
jgi:tRNA nucleotidyltransferase/poly(A) polymerase